MNGSAASHPTPYPDVNALLEVLLREVREVLGAEFVGLYLYGSLASGDFDPPSSDIDFLVVTEHALPEATVAALRVMHARIAAGGEHWAHELEGSYIPRAALRRYNPANARHPSIGVDWPFGVYDHGDWLIPRYTVREMGVTVAGPPPQTLIDPLNSDDLRAAVCQTLHSWWAENVADPHRLAARNYQAFAVLTMCRALYTLEHGALVSKPVAARWAEARFVEWAPLIADALAGRAGNGPPAVEETLRFIRFTIARCPAPGAEGA